MNVDIGDISYDDSGSIMVSGRDHKLTMMKQAVIGTSYHTQGGIIEIPSGDYYTLLHKDYNDYYSTRDDLIRDNYDAIITIAREEDEKKFKDTVNRLVAREDFEWGTIFWSDENEEDERLKFIDRAVNTVDMDTGGIMSFIGSNIVDLPGWDDVDDVVYRAMPDGGEYKPGHAAFVMYNRHARVSLELSENRETGYDLTVDGVTNSFSKPSDIFNCLKRLLGYDTRKK